MSRLSEPRGNCSSRHHLRGSLRRSFLSLVLTLASISLVAAVPAPFQNVDHIPTINHIATYDDIAAQYGSIYKISKSCPDALVFGEPSIDERQVAFVEIASIQEDASVCSGPSPMVLVLEATVEQEGLLSALGLSGFQDALDANQDAGSLIDSSADTSMLVRWHAGESICGPVSYSSSNIYFVIREANAFRISFNRDERVDLLTFPPLLKTLLIVTPNSTVCLLADRSSNPGADAMLMSTENGESTTTTLVPFGSEAAASGPSPFSSITPATIAGGGLTSTGPTSPSEIEPTALEPLPSPSEEDLVYPSPSVLPLQPAFPDLVPSAEPEESSAGLSGNFGANGVVPGVQPFSDSTVEEAGEDQAAPTVTMGPVDADGGSACFPEQAVMTLECGEKRKMAQLAVGDRVVSGDGTASDVMLFTHSERDSMSHFVRFTTECGRSLSVSAGHYVYANGGILQAAESLGVGDELEVAGVGASRIVSVEGVYARGLYNAQTLSGVVVVDGFVASTYTRTVDPALAHGALLAPVRLLYSTSVLLAAPTARLFVHGSPTLGSLARGVDASMEHLGS